MKRTACPSFGFSKGASPPARVPMPGNTVKSVKTRWQVGDVSASTLARQPRAHLAWSCAEPNRVSAGVADRRPAVRPTADKVPPDPQAGGPSARAPAEHEPNPAGAQGRRASP